MLSSPIGHDKALEAELALEKVVEGVRVGAGVCYSTEESPISIYSVYSSLPTPVKSNEPTIVDLVITAHDRASSLKLVSHVPSMLRRVNVLL